MSTHITGIGWITPTNMGRMKDHSLFIATLGPLPEIPLTGLGAAARRMDTHSRLALAAIGYCLDDAGLTHKADRRNTGIFAATENACLVTDSDYYHTVLETGGAGASPGLFSYTLPSSFLGEAAILYGFTGPTLVVNEGNLNGIACLEMCLEALLLKEADIMLCGIANLPLPSTIPSEENHFNGALFLCLERLPARKPSYGTIGFNEKGNVDFRGSRVADLFQIVHRCLDR